MCAQCKAYQIFILFPINGYFVLDDDLISMFYQFFYLLYTRKCSLEGLNYTKCDHMSATNNSVACWDSQNLLKLKKSKTRCQQTIYDSSKHKSPLNNFCCEEKRRCYEFITWSHVVQSIWSEWWSPVFVCYWNHLKVCVSVCVSILVSLCASLAVGSAA